MKAVVTEEAEFSVEFYDVDSMRVVWHGNYVKYMEIGRCALLDKIGFGYAQMEKSGYAFPVVDLKIKYRHPLFFGDKARIVAGLTEYENCIKITYEIFNAKSGVLCAKGESTQMAVKIEGNETKYICPSEFIERVEKLSE